MTIPSTDDSTGTTANGQTNGEAVGQPKYEWQPGYGMAVSTSLDDAILALEDGFWDERESLRQIYDASLYRMCPPWSVLACCVARALVFVRPNAVLPPIVGGPGSLNWFAALVGDSSGGKSSSLSVARELVNIYVFQRNLGSGEGLVSTYKCKPDGENPDGKRESVMFTADEVDAVDALQKRSGSTLRATIQTAYSGALLGFSYRSDGTHLPPHSYRMTMLINVQPRRAGVLLEGAESGFPQRIQWFPAFDRRITVEMGEAGEKMPIYGLPIPINAYMYPRTLRVPDEVKRIIREIRVDQQRGLATGLDGHSAFTQLKFAYGLAVLDNRDEMTMQDWELASIAMDISDATRSWVVREMETARREKAAESGTDRAVAQVAADEAKLDIETRKAERVMMRAAEKIRQAGAEGMTKRAVEQLFSGKQRRYLDAALIALECDGYVTREIVPNVGGGLPSEIIKWVSQAAAS